FWLIVPHNQQHKDDQSGIKIKEVLQAIQPPDGATVLVLSADHVGDAWSVVGLYSTDLKIETLRTHYMQEFSRHGFVYNGEDNSKESQSFKFCKAGYFASLSFSKPERHPHMYTIFLNQSDGTC